MGANFQRYYLLHPARSLMWLLSASCLVLLYVLYLLPYAIELRIAGFIFVVAALTLVGLRDAGLGLANSCVAFNLEGANDITLIQRNGQQLAGKICDGGLVTPFLVVMNIKINERGKRNIVLMPDSMSCDDFRHLCVVLRWNR